MHSQSRILPNIEDLFMAELYNCKLDVLAADELYCALHNIALNILSSCLTTDQVYSWLHVYFPVRQANLIIAYCRHFMRTGHDTKVVIVCQLVISFIAREIARLSSMFIEHSTGGKRSIVTLKDIKTALYYDKNLQYLLFGRLPLQSYSSTPKYCSTKNNLDNSSFVNNLSDDVKLSIQHFHLQEKLFLLDIQILLNIFILNDQNLILITKHSENFLRMLDQENSYDVTELSKYVEHAIYTRQFDPMFEFDHQKSTTSYNDQYCCPSAKSMLIRYLLPYLNSVVRFRLLDHLSLWKHILRLTVRKGEFLIVKLLNRICRYFALKVERQRTRLSSDIHDMQLSVHRSEYFNEHCEHQHFVLFQQCLERPLTLEVSKALGNSKLLIQNGFLDRYSQSKHRYIKTYIFLTDSYIFLCSVNTNGKRTSSLKQSVRLPFSQTINSEYQQYNNNLYSLKYLCAIENIEVNEQYVTSGMPLSDVMNKNIFLFQIKFSKQHTVGVDNHKEDAVVLMSCRKQKEKHKWIGSILFAQNRIRYQHDLQHITAMKYNEIPLLSPSESFTCEDSSSNIIIDAANQIKAATFEKYFEKATCPLMGGNLNLLNSFLSCYRLYRKPDYVLDLALRRYAVSEPTIDSIVDNSNASKSEMLEKYNVEVMIPVQIRVLNFLKIWLDQYVFEAERNCFDALSQRILQFINTISGLRAFTGLRDEIRSIITKAKTDGLTICSGISKQKDNILFMPATPFEYHIACIPEQFSILTLHPIELARQITLLEWSIFRRISIEELLNKNWQRKDKETVAPNIFQMTKLWNKLSFWVRKEIIDAPSINERAAVITRFLEIAQVCLSLNNFSGLFAITSGGLGFSAIRDLTDTWKKLPIQSLEILDTFESFYDNGHYRPYVEHLHSVSPPCVPFLPDYLSKVLKIGDGNPDYCYDNQKSTEHRLINVSKHLRFYALVKDLQIFQSTPYNLAPHPDIQDYILKLDPLQGHTVDSFEDYLYSRKVEIMRKPLVEGSKEENETGLSVPSHYLISPGIKPSVRKTL